MNVAKLILDQQINHWNRVVGKHLRLVRETATHFEFIHVTKGPRRIAKKRLGL
jgi:hypothetical protein